MNETVSNKTLVILLVVAIGVSVMGIWVSVSKQDQVYLTGAVTQEGTATLTISNLSSIVATDNQINVTVAFTGNVTGSVQVTTNATCEPSAACVVGHDNFTVENTGNQPVALTVTGVGYSNPTTYFSTTTQIGAAVVEAEAGSCTSGLASSSNVTNASTDTICSTFQSDDNNDELAIFVTLDLSSDETGGSQSFQWQFEAT